MKKEPTIRTTPKGPYVVSGLKKLTESNTNTFKLDDPTVALCRCGRSRTRPFCNGTHGKIEVRDEKSQDRVPRKLESYVGKEITIHDDRGICSHAGFCTDGLPRVFRMGLEPWIDPDGETKENIIETIRKCPSGALSYSIDGERYDAFSDGVKIVVTEDGPYSVQGNFTLKDQDIPQTGDHYTLCRCGHSRNKPFCSGQHWYEKFADDGKVKQPDPGSLDRDPFDNKMEAIQRLARTGKSENSAMRTLETFPDFKTLVFKGCQLSRMPLNEGENVNLKTVIGEKARKPMELEIPFYVSHMSFGALSKEAKVALAKGSTLVGTAVGSGEGGMLPESRRVAKRYIYELGTAKFSHDEESMKKADAVEIKIGQGVKPGLGGHLPGSKVTPEIAKIRNLKPGEDSVSPGRFAGVDSIEDLKQLVAKIRELTGGVPVGIKMAAGHIEEDLAHALMADPDFITLDCRGGATGSSPKFLKDNVGVPAIFAIRRARRFLDTMGGRVTLCVTGGFRDSSDIAKGLALGADAVALATASMVAIGCLQSRVCHTGTCPAGIATQDEGLRKLFNEEKALRMFVNFYEGTARELKIFARSNGRRDIHSLDISDLMTTSSEVSLNTDIEHV